MGIESADSISEGKRKYDKEKANGEKGDKD